jgi:hypothetical protein
MMKQQHPSQGNHLIETALTDLSKELWNLLLQVGDLHRSIEQQLRTAQDQQVKGQLTEIQKLIQQHLPGITIRSLYDTVTTVLWNAGRNLLNEITNYKKLIGDRGKTQAEAAEENIEAAKKNIEDMAKVFEEAITYLKNTIGKLQQGASTLTQKLQSQQTSAQQQEIASVIQQAINTIGDISNIINSITQKLKNLEAFFAQTQQEVKQLLGQKKQQTADAGASPEGSADDSSSAPPTLDQLKELEKKIMDLYEAVQALEAVVKTAKTAASIIPPQIEGLNTKTLARELKGNIGHRSLNNNLDVLGNYIGRELPDLFVKLGLIKQQQQGSVTKPHFLKQQQAAPGSDIPEGIKSYLEEVKTFLVDARNRLETDLRNILKEVSKLGDNLDKISDIVVKQKARRIYSIPALIILGECERKLTEEMPSHLIETIAPILGVLLIAEKFWDSFLKWDTIGTATKALTQITNQLQDPKIKTALLNVQGSAGRMVGESEKVLSSFAVPPEKQAPVPTEAAEQVGAAVFGALGQFVLPAVQRLNQITAPSHEEGYEEEAGKPERFYVITNTYVIEKIKERAAKRKTIPTNKEMRDLTRVGVIRNAKEMINTFAVFMEESWGNIAWRINDDISNGRLSDPQRKIQNALDEVNDAWEALKEKMRDVKWAENYKSDNVGLEKRKIEEIRSELEKLIGALFKLREAWRAAKKPTEGALNIEALLFHPLGLPALTVALRTLPPPIPNVTIAGGVEIKQREPAVEQEKKATAEAGIPRREESEPRTEVGQQKGGAKKRPRYSGKIRVPVSEEEIAMREIRNAIGFINKEQVNVGGALNAITTAINTLIRTGRQKSQPQGALPEPLRNAIFSLSMARLKLSDAKRFDLKSEEFKTLIAEAHSYLQSALKILQNPTERLTPYLGRKLLLLMKTLHSMPTTTQPHRQKAKDEVILEKETI